MEPHPFIGINQRSYGSQFLTFTFIVLSSYVIFSLIGLGVLLIIGGQSLESIQSMDFVNMSKGDINLYKVMQVLSSIGIFIIPAVIFSYLKTGDGLQYLQWKKGAEINPTILSVVIMVVAFPVLLVLMIANQAMVLPDFLQGMETWMKEQELQLAGLTEVFLQMDSIGDFLLNLLMIAIIPAIGEEMLFRGGLQKLLQDWTKKPHLAIFISAAIFSAIHVQFYGFVPRMIIGMLLGYLFYWSNNLWYPIIGHFINNGVQVVAVYAGQMDISSETPTFETMPTDAKTSLLFMVVGSLVLGSVLLYLFRSNFKYAEA
ncbi:MAG: CPBP family intramembrane glutamic endopeptidase [Chitinophagales bacterium]